MKALISTLLAAVCLLSASDAPGANPGGSHGLRNRQYQLFLRPRDANSKDGTPIVLYPQQPWKCMAWKFEDQQNGARLVNYFTGKSFEVLQTTGAQLLVQQAATPERVKAQSWRFVPVGAGFYRIETADGNGVLTAIKSSETEEIQVVVQPWHDLGCQKWELVPVPDHFTA